MSATIAATKDRVDVIQNQFQVYRNEFNEFEGQMTVRIVAMESQMVFLILHFHLTLLERTCYQSGCDGRRWS